MVPKEELQQEFDRIWSEIRGAKLYAGQPRSRASAHSVSLAQQALQLARDSGSNRWLLEARRMLVYSLTANEQYEEANSYYPQTIEGLEQAGEHAQAARTKIGYVAALLHAGRYTHALDVSHSAEQWLLEHGDENGFARLCTNIAILHHRLDQHMEAYRYLQMAVETFKKLGEQQSLAQTYLNLGNALASIDRFERADAAYEESQTLSRQLGLVDLWAQANYNRAYLHFLRSRYSDALQSFARLRRHFEESGSMRHYALCDLDEAEIYLQLNLSKDAAGLATRAADHFQRLKLTYEHAKATAFYGVAMTQFRRFSEALDSFHTAQIMFETEGNVYWIGLLNLYRAQVHFSLRRFGEAQALARQAKGTFETLAIPSKRIFSLVLLGRIALALNDLVAAEECTNEIAALIDTKIPLVLFPYHVLRAEIAERLQKWDEARRHYELAAEDMEQHWARLHHDDLRVTFFKGRHEAYDALVRSSLDRMGPQEGLAAAYSWCERARARGLVELLSHYAPRGHGRAEQSLLSKINRLREELNIQYARSQPEVRPIPSCSNFETIALKEQDLARSLREVAVLDPEYVSLQQVSSATLDSVRAALPKHTTLIEYFTAGGEVLAFIVSRDEARVVRHLCPPGRVLNVQERLRFQFEKFMLGDAYVGAHSDQVLESTKRHLQVLFQNLMAPFFSDIRTPHITIVPHGTLHFLPFHAFFTGKDYVIDHHEVSYAPSASVLKYCLEKEEVAEQSPLLVGVADEYAPLVNEEISMMNRLFPKARVLRNDAATRQAFTECSQEAAFIHIAAHTIFRQDNPMFSSFKLADGWFTALDLFSINCHTNLVTLSGCQSGMGEITGSDDLLGLMRGFLYAGALSLLVSLWSINDESTTALMVRFYQEWKKGPSKSTALRSAMLALRETHPNPFYWAPFLLAGNP